MLRFGGRKVAAWGCDRGKDVPLLEKVVEEESAVRDFRTGRLDDWRGVVVESEERDVVDTLVEDNDVIVAWVC